MLEKLKEIWGKVYVCASIFLSRVQVLLGIVWATLLVTDLSPFFSNPKAITAYLIANGVITEFARRYKTRDTLEG